MNFFKIYLTALIVISIGIETQLFQQDILAYTQNKTILANSVCPVDAVDNRTIIENFLTEPDWSSERIETNTEHLTISQITVLNVFSHNGVCTSFNEVYQESLGEDNGLGEPAYNTTYYKVGTFYFIVISIRQSDTLNVITTGLSYIHIYNESQELLEAYAF